MSDSKSNAANKVPSNGLIFSGQGATEKTFHGAYSRRPMEIRGNFRAMGQQPVRNDGGTPEWVACLFDANPDLTQVALNTKSGGVVWTRP